MIDISFPFISSVRVAKKLQIEINETLIFGIYGQYSFTYMAINDICIHLTMPFCELKEAFLEVMLFEDLHRCHKTG